jgi:hypothetical protein
MHIHSVKIVLWTPGYTPTDRLTSWGVLHYPCTVPVYMLPQYTQSLKPRGYTANFAGYNTGTEQNRAKIFPLVCGGERYYKHVDYRVVFIKQRATVGWRIFVLSNIYVSKSV